MTVESLRTNVLKGIKYIYNKTYIQYMNFIKYSIDFLTLHREYDVNDTILIFGAPRSGTTWLMEILSCIPRYKTVFEPLHRYWYPQVSNLNIPYRPYLSPSQENPNIHNYLKNVFSGKVISRIPRYRFINFPQRIYANKLIVKFVRANRLIPWILKRFDVKAAYFIIRHPCATIASQMKSKELVTGYVRKKDGQREDYIPTKNEILKEIELIDIFEDRKDEIFKLLNNLYGPEEILAFIWAVDHYVPLYYLRKDPPLSKKIYLVFYENLVIDYHNEIKNIFDFINENIPDKVYELKRTPSITTHDKNYIGTTKQLEKWKRKLSTQEIQRILNITSNIFELDFYDESILPIYTDILKL